MEATARNDSVTLQIVWQVQRGCRTHCYATSQTQVAEQVAETVQQVVAVATGGASDAMAANASRTVQLIVQRQIGCVAFCYGTSQRQLASQLATTVQIAIALGGGGASSNVGSTLQLSWQQQLGCRVHCYATWEGQGLSQAAMTSQTASAAGRADAGDGTSVSRDRGGRRPLRQRGGGAWAELRALVASLARNANVTVQVVRQVERSGCRSWCVGDTQVQLATEQASAAQDAAATVLGRRELAA